MKRALFACAYGGAYAQPKLPNTGKLTKGQIIDYLQNVDKVPLKKLSNDLRKLGFELLEYRPEKNIYKFSHVKNELRGTGGAKANLESSKVMVEIHCDAKSGPHMHITDRYGNIYDKNLNNLSAKYRKDNPYASKQLPVKHNFANESKLLEHFEKHGGEFKGAYKTPEEYLQGANFVIEHGHKVKYQYMGKERTGYVRFMGNSRNLSVDEAIKNFSKREMGLSKQHEFGEAKFEFLALRDDGAIATYHTQGAENFYHTLNQNSKNSTVNVEHLSCRMM